jgi:hypothetical protein
MDSLKGVANPMVGNIKEWVKKVGKVRKGLGRVRWGPSQ